VLAVVPGIVNGSCGDVHRLRGKQIRRSTGQYVNDKSLAVRVHDALRDNPDYKFDDVNVDVFRGTVQLSGFVNTSDEKSKAGDIAKNVQGVKDVENNINVKETQ
jgi:hyperosmotically inducible periplasmic protein